jgi:hypothetical protein
MITTESGFKLLDYFKYDYKQIAVVLLVVELSEGREAVDRLLDGISALQVRRNAEHFLGQLRDALGMIGPTPTDPPPTPRKTHRGSPRKAIA